MTSCSPMLRMLIEAPSVPYERIGVTKVSASPIPATVVEWWIASSRFFCAPIDAGFHQIPSLPGFRRDHCLSHADGLRPVGSSRKSAPSLPLTSCARALPARSAESATLERSRLVDQHDRNVVAHGVAQPALVAERAPAPLRDTRARSCTWGRREWRAAAATSVIAVFRRELIAESARGAGVLPPVGKHLHPEIEIDRRADEASRSSCGRLRRCSRMRCALAADEDALLAFALDVQYCANVHRRATSRNSSISHATLYGTSSSSCSSAVSRTSSATKKRTVCVLISSSG